MTVPSVTGERVTTNELALIETELRRMGIKTLLGRALPLDSAEGAALLIRALGKAHELNVQATSLHEAADSHVAKLSVALRYAFAVGRKQVGGARSLGKVARAMRSALDKVLPQMLAKVVADGGRLATGGLLKTADGQRNLARPFFLRFDGKNPSVVEWAKEHAGELIQNIIDVTLDRIRAASEEFQDEGDWDLYHDQIVAAVGDEERADLIARHETMLAANEGQRIAWKQAEEQGLLNDSAKRVWITTPDERLCPICQELEGKTASLNGEYSGGYVGPPAHVQCRCTEGIQ